MRQVQNERSLGELFGDLSRELSTLVREEGALARTEMTQRLKQLGAEAGLLIVGGFVLYAGLLVFAATAIIALAYALPWWLAALIVAVVVSGAGGLLVMIGMMGLRHTSPAPSQTIETLCEDVQAIRRHV